jgi:hypothetical protein
MHNPAAEAAIVDFFQQFCQIFGTTLKGAVVF